MKNDISELKMQFGHLLFICLDIHAQLPHSKDWNNTHISKSALLSKMGRNIEYFYVPGCKILNSVILTLQISTRTLRIHLINVHVLVLLPVFK